MLREEIRIKLTYAPKEYNWVECYAIVGEKRKDGTPRTLVGGVLVITERKLIEEERRIKEEKERMIADSVSLFLYQYRCIGSNTFLATGKS